MAGSHPHPQLLAKPFTIHTAFTRTQRKGDNESLYAFVTTSCGRDLSTILVGEGLARAFGITRQQTDWTHLAEDRAEERHKSAELQTVLKDSQSTSATNPNTATA
jgi:hypothetical protein